MNSKKLTILSVLAGAWLCMSIAPSNAASVRDTIQFNAWHKPINPSYTSYRQMEEYRYEVVSYTDAINKEIGRLVEARNKAIDAYNKDAYAFNSESYRHKSKIPYIGHEPYKNTTHIKNKKNINKSNQTFPEQREQVIDRIISLSQLLSKGTSDLTPQKTNNPNHWQYVHTSGHYWPSQPNVKQKGNLPQDSYTLIKLNSDDLDLLKDLLEQSHAEKEAYKHEKKKKQDPLDLFLQFLQS